MRAVSVHGDVVVVTSAIWQTTCTAVRAGSEAFVIDSPVLPEELGALPGLVEQAGFVPVGLLATHGDWDHLLGRLAFPGLALGCAQTTADRLSSQPGGAQRELRDFDERFYLARPRPLALGATQALPVPGRCELGERELELHDTSGHTADGMAVLIPWAEVLVCGDYLSPVEIPTIAADGGAEAYLATLERLEALVGGMRWVVPGHGVPLSRADAQALLAEDRAYVSALAARGRAGAGAIPLPAWRRDPEQRRLHAQNLARIEAG